MKLVRIDPPGSLCFHEAVSEMIDRKVAPGIRDRAIRFVEVGCGAGDLSRRLCDAGHTGLGIDFSEQAVQATRANLARHIESGRFELMCADFTAHEQVASRSGTFDLAMSMMVMEHVRDDVGFLERLSALVRPGGHVMVGVPARMDRWSIEDDTVGHLRRYSREQLAATLAAARLTGVEVWSIGVPVSNILFHMSNYMIGRSEETRKAAQSRRKQTEASGIREIPFKTVFPPIFRLVLNRVTLYPLLVAQRMFYNTGLGLTILAAGTVE